MPTAVVTDSTSDIPADLAQRYAIQIVPNVMIIAGQEYEDGKGLSREGVLSMASNHQSPTHHRNFIQRRL